MPGEIRIPRLGWNMEEGTFLGWLRKDGDAVRAGDPLFTLEGEKAAQDVEAVEDGILRIAPTAPGPGAVVSVGAVIGHIVRPGEAPPDVAPASAANHAPPTLAIAPPATATAPPYRKRPRSSPLARRIAREMGVDWKALQGSGSSGRIRKVDVLAATREDGPRLASSARSIPVGPARRTIAARMVESSRLTAPVTLTTTVDATNLVNLRDQFRSADPADVPSYSDFIVKLTALALRGHPLLNARWEGDRIDLASEINVGIAVDTEAGLLVPVIQGAGEMGLRQVAARSRDLIARARAGSLKAAEMQGGTFTVTNLGAFGIEAFTPIINLPECAILGLGRIARGPAMVGDRIEARERLTLSLTFDHRVVDGAPAAQFLRDVARRIENPGPWLMS